MYTLNFSVITPVKFGIITPRQIKECSWSYAEGKGVCILTQLGQQSVLQLAQRIVVLLRWREDLDCPGKQIFPEGKTQNVEVVPTITECAIQSHEH